VAADEHETFLSERIREPWYRTGTFWIWFVVAHVVGAVIIVGYVLIRAG
jgi:hypothetical protein